METDHSRTRFDQKFSQKALLLLEFPKMRRGTNCTSKMKSLAMFSHRRSHPRQNSYYLTHLHFCLCQPFGNEVSLHSCPLIALDHVAFFRISLGQLRQRFYGGAGSISSSLQFWRAAAIEAETASQQRFNELIQFLGSWPFSIFFFSLGKLDAHTHNVEWQNFHHIPHRYNIFTCVILIHYAYTAYMHTVTVHF